MREYPKDKVSRMSTTELQDSMSKLSRKIDTLIKRTKIITSTLKQELMRLQAEKQALDNTIKTASTGPELLGAKNRAADLRDLQEQAIRAVKKDGQQLLTVIQDAEDDLLTVAKELRRRKN